MWHVLSAAWHWHAWAALPGSVGGSLGPCPVVPCRSAARCSWWRKCSSLPYQPPAAAAATPGAGSRALPPSNPGRLLSTQRSTAIAACWQQAGPWGGPGRLARGAGPASVFVTHPMPDCMWKAGQEGGDLGLGVTEIFVIKRWEGARRHSIGSCRTRGHSRKAPICGAMFQRPVMCSAQYLQPQLMCARQVHPWCHLRVTRCDIAALLAALAALPAGDSPGIVRARSIFDRFRFAPVPASPRPTSPPAKFTSPRTRLQAAARQPWDQSRRGTWRRGCPGTPTTCRQTALTATLRCRRPQL